MSRGWVHRDALNFLSTTGDADDDEAAPEQSAAECVKLGQFVIDGRVEHFGKYLRETEVEVEKWFVALGGPVCVG